MLGRGVVALDDCNEWFINMLLMIYQLEKNVDLCIMLLRCNKQ